MDSGRSFTVRVDGTLVPVAKNFDADADRSLSSVNSKAPMKVIISRATADSFKTHLKYPVGRTVLNNINDSMNIRDFLEYGASSDPAGGRSKGEFYGNNTTYDVKKWR